MEKSHSLAEEWSNADDVITLSLYPMRKSPRNFIEIRSCATFGDSTRWTGFLVISRSMEASGFFFLLKTKKSIHWFIYDVSESLRNYASSISSRFHCPTNCSNPGSLILVNRAYLMTKKGKIALSTTKNIFSLSLLPSLLFHILIGPCFYTIFETRSAWAVP